MTAVNARAVGPRDEQLQRFPTVRDRQAALSAEYRPAWPYAYVRAGSESLAATRGNDMTNVNNDARISEGRFRQRHGPDTVEHDCGSLWGPHRSQRITLRPTAGSETGLPYVYDRLWNECRVLGESVSKVAVESAFDEVVTWHGPAANERCWCGMCVSNSHNAY
jgi:hypothetical protein